jgi:hypothetical protein
MTCLRVTNYLCHIRRRRYVLFVVLPIQFLPFSWRSRANWHDNGEKCSQYFCKLERTIFIKTTITELIDDAGHHISDQSKILLQQHDFYKTLYSITNLNFWNACYDSLILKISEASRLRLNIMTYKAMDQYLPKKIHNNLQHIHQKIITKPVCYFL